MILANKKMRAYLEKDSVVNMNKLEEISFKKIGKGYFFEKEVNANVKIVSDAYAEDKDFDWSGFEYSTNKIHLEDVIQADLPDVVIAGIGLAKRLFDRFKVLFPNLNVVFWVGFDEFGEYPSVTLSFYVKRDGMLPLMPEDESSLEAFDNAIFMVF